MIGHSFLPLFCLVEEIFVLGLPSPTFSPVACLQGPESYILITVYLSSDCKVFSDKAQGLTYILGPLTPTIYIYIYIINLGQGHQLIYLLHLEAQNKKKKLNFLLQHMIFSIAMRSRFYKILRFGSRFHTDFISIEILLRFRMFQGCRILGS